MLLPYKNKSQNYLKVPFFKEIIKLMFVATMDFPHLSSDPLTIDSFTGKLL